MKALLDRDMDRMVFDPPQLGCVLYLPGVPGAGSKIYDRSPYGNNGTITGAVWKKSPGGLWILNYDGSDDLVTVTHNSGIDPAASSFSVGGWVRGATDHPATTYPMRKGGSKYWQLRTSAQHPLFILWDGAVSPQAQDNGTSLNDNVWHHIVGVRNYGVTITLYVDGVDKAHPADNAGSISDTGNLILGNLGAIWFKGHMALNFMVMRAMSAFEVFNKFNQEKHLLGVW